MKYILWMAALAALAVVSAIVFGINPKEAQVKDCQQAASKIKKTNAADSIAKWVDANISDWSSGKGVGEIKYPMGRGDSAVPFVFKEDVFGKDPEAQLIHDSLGRLVAVQIVDIYNKSIVISITPRRWYGWSSDNVLEVSQRVAVVCNLRD